MNSGTKNIIVVDDNPVLICVLREILRENGWQVRSASDGFAALAEMHAQVPDILISDLNMKGMSGFELLSVVRRRFPLVVVIAMSGAYSGQSVPSGIAADAFYEKGASGVDRLLNLVSDIQAGPGRDAVPIFLPPIPASAAPKQALLASCPYCLRPFSFYLHRSDSTTHEANCPHCAQRSEVTLVGHFGRTDGTLFIEPAKRTDVAAASLADIPASGRHR